MRWRPCLHAPKHNRFIELSTQNTERWVVLDVSNYYSGNIIVNNETPISTKDNATIHGLGLKSVNEIAKHVGGFVTYDIDDIKNIFRVRVHVPKVKITKSK